MLKLLCQPLQLGGMTLKNRMVMPPMVVRYATDEGFITDRSVNYYEARAEGGVGLMIQESTYVHPDGQILPNEPAIYDDRFIPGLSRIAAAAHRHGAKMAVQLVHGGRTAFFGIPGGKPVAPSPVAAPGYPVPVELNKPQIDEIIKFFALAAYRARRAGYDGVEIHGAHGYLIDQFISPASNKRADEYGGSLENRARLLTEVIGAVREAVGRGLAVWCRINGRDFGIPGGETVEDARRVAQLAEKAGAAAIHVSAAGAASPVNYPTHPFAPGVISDLAAQIKEAVTVPVIAVGRMTPEFGEKLLQEGKADLIGFGRQLLADPELPNKVCAGNLEDIRHCILCFRCRDGLRSSAEVGVRCSVNVLTGREGTFEIKPTEGPKRVLVVGGGPAGMEAARVAANRGHQVALWEKEDKLGGQLIPASAAPYKDRMGALPQYYAHALKDAGVKIKLNKEATERTVLSFKPDSVILATGAKSVTPGIPNLQKARVVAAGELLRGRATITGEKVVVIGGELVACEVAQYLADKGKQVTIVRRGTEIAQKVGVSLRRFVLDNLKKYGVNIITDITYNEVTEKGLIVTTKEGEKKLLPADTIVLAAGAEPDQTLYHALKDKVPEVKIVGDCVSPRNIMEAVADGYRAGLNI